MSWCGLPAFVPDWPLPAGVKALQTECGQGPAPYGGFNLGDHVGDEMASVAAHRQRLVQVTGVSPIWLRQVHGMAVHNIDALPPEPPEPPEADAAVTRQRGVACTVLTADCLPVLVADRQARVVGAAHAGWRGLADGVIQQLIGAMTRVPGVTTGDLTVWLGPAIGPMAFEVGQEVVDAFTMQHARQQAYFRQHPVAAGKYLADLPGLASDILQGCGVGNVTVSGLCTVSLADRFYSYRREGVTGRMASLIWLE